MRKPKQLEFKKVKGWGGQRKGAGRKNQSSRVNHMERAKVNFKKPLMITMKLKDGLRGLRNKSMLEKFTECAAGVKPFGLHVLHFSIETNHLHILVEARDNESLANGMRSLGCRLGKAIRKMLGGRGGVFNGRYHLRLLATPTEVKRGLAYVLLNQAKHAKLIPHVDDYSSARHFKDWRALLARKIGPILGDWKGVALPAYLSHPRSWLAQQGWRRALA